MGPEEHRLMQDARIVFFRYSVLHYTNSPSEVATTKRQCETLGKSFTHIIRPFILRRNVQRIIILCIPPPIQITLRPCNRMPSSDP